MLFFQRKYSPFLNVFKFITTMHSLSISDTSFFFFFLHFALFNKLSSTQLCSIYRSFQKRKRKLQCSEIQQETSTFLPFFSCFYALIQLHYIRNVVCKYVLHNFLLSYSWTTKGKIILWSRILCYSTAISREIVYFFMLPMIEITFQRNIVKVPEKINLNATSKRL